MTRRPAHAPATGHDPATDRTRNTVNEEPEPLAPCPHCAGAYTYEMGALLVCPECGHEWAPSSVAPADEDGDGRWSRTRSATCSPTGTR
ncbi:hypothetical protein [Streptomyces gougerotii]